MRNKLSHFLVLLPFLISFYGFGSNINTANLYYECKGNGIYNLTLEVFTECEDNQNILEDEKLLAISYTSKKLGITQSAIVTQSFSQWTSLRCQSYQSTTKCSSSGTERGIYKHVYYGTLNLNSYNDTDDWVLSFAKNARSTFSNYGITSQNIPFYTSTTLNTQIGCNSNPKINSSSVLPMFKTCVGMTEEFDLALKDSDNDELKFRFETPKFSETSSLTYKNGFSATSPITGSISISANGVLSISAENLNEIGLTTLVIEEWRNGSKIGETKKDIQIETFDCSNEAPILSDLDNGTRTIKICELDTLDAFLLKEDPDVGDNTSFFIDSTSTGAPTNIFQPSGKFSGIMKSQYVGTHTYKIGVRDDACPFSKSVFKIFTIEVVPLPAFDLGETDMLVNCNIGKTYEPVIVGKKPFTFLWQTEMIKEGDFFPKETVSSEASFTINSLDTATTKHIFLTVVDSIGCSNSDSVFLNNSLVADFDAITRCIGADTDYDNLSTAINSTITKYDWDFGFDNTNKDQNSVENPVVLYPNVGEFSVKLTITNDFGCVDTDSQIVMICDHPKDVSYFRKDSCSLERFSGQGGVPFLDITNYDNTPCGLDKLSAFAYKVGESTPFASLEFERPYIQNPFFFQFPEKGEYKVIMRTTTEAKCVDEYESTFTIHPRPTIRMIQEDFNINCDFPDTTLSATLDPTAPGTGDLTYVWTKNSRDLGFLVNDKQGFTSDSTWGDVNSLGAYYTKVTDSLLCSHQVDVRISYPLEAKFKYSQVCEPDDIMTFTEIATKKAFKIVERTWVFGDGNSDNNNNDIVEHYYNVPNNYTVTLKMVDSTGCTDEFTNIVYNSFPIDRFEVNPVLAEKDAFCKEGLLLGYGNYPDSNVAITHIDTVRWTWSGKEYIYSNETDPKKGHLPIYQSYEITDQYVPTNVDSLKVEYMIEYNLHPEMDILTTCKRIPEGISERVKEAIKGNSVVYGGCTRDSLTAKFDLTSDSKIVEWNWEINKFGTEDQVFQPSNDSVFKHFVDTTLANISLAVYLQLKNEEGCVLPKFLAGTETVKEVQPVTLEFEKDTICLGDIIQVSAFETSTTTDAVLDRFILTNQTTNDTLIGNDPNNFLNFTPEGLGKNFITTNQSIQFLQEGLNKISLYLTDVNPITNGYEYCGTYTYDSIMVYPAPKLAFDYVPVCSGDTVSINNKSTVELDEIISYQWTFSDASISNDKNPNFTAKGGFQDISLEVTTAQGCSNAGNNKIDTTVYFYYTPVADFIVDSEELEAYLDLPFESTSTVEGEGEFINHAVSTWDLGDGTIKTGESFSHSYDEIAIYPVKHSVISNQGCRADITKNINLNTYLNIATGFSPNNDGNNDEFSLIHKEISELHEYKIYNRWGELVFDGGNDPNATWDGTFRGVDQEVGVYILYVKGTGAYDVEYNFKENITLIR